MVSKVKKISAALALVVTHSSAMAAPIEVIPYGDVVGSGLITFTGLGSDPPGTNYDGILSVNGVSFGERFAGQKLSSTLENFDQLSGTPSEPLTLKPGEQHQNLVILSLDENDVLAGLGPLKFPEDDAIGEGAFAVRFERPQASLGFALLGVAGGKATVDFFRVDGTLIATLTLDLEDPQGTGIKKFGFLRKDSVDDIAGFSVFNDDSGGIGLDDLIFTPRDGQPVPEPASIALIGIALALLAGRRRA